MRFLYVFATARTGSNHLNRLLRSCPEFNAKAELFHPHLPPRVSPQERAALEARAECTFDDRALRTWLREHPADALDAIYKGGGQRIVIFKLFPGQLPLPVIASQFLENADMRFAVLRRRPIECFISREKANSLDRFLAVDTTEIKPAIAAAAFVAWAIRTQRWYEWVLSNLAARGLTHVELSFERHLDTRSGEDALGQILALLRPLGTPEIAIPRRVLVGARQDREAEYQNRVANWPEFEGEVRSNPTHAALLDWAERAP